MNLYEHLSTAAPSSPDPARRLLLTVETRSIEGRDEDLAASLLGATAP